MANSFSVAACAVLGGSGVGEVNRADEAVTDPTTNTNPPINKIKNKIFVCLDIVANYIIRGGGYKPPPRDRLLIKQNKKLQCNSYLACVEYVASKYFCHEYEEEGKDDNIAHRFFLSNFLGTPE